MRYIIDTTIQLLIIPKATITSDVHRRDIPENNISKDPNQNQAAHRSIRNISVILVHFLCTTYAVLINKSATIHSQIFVGIGPRANWTLYRGINTGDMVRSEDRYRANIKNNALKNNLVTL